MFQANRFAIALDDEHSGHTGPRSGPRNRPSGSSNQAVPGRDATTKSRSAVKVSTASGSSKVSHPRSSSVQGQVTKNVRRPQKLLYDRNSLISISDTSGSETGLPPPDPEASESSRTDGAEQRVDMSNPVRRRDTISPKSPIPQGRGTRPPGEQYVLI